MMHQDGCTHCEKEQTCPARGAKFTRTLESSHKLPGAISRGVPRQNTWLQVLEDQDFQMSKT